MEFVRNAETILNIILIIMKNSLAKADLPAGILPLDKSSGNSKSGIDQNLSVIKTQSQ
jgi:hypothetical protein